MIKESKQLTLKFRASQRHHVPSWIIIKIADLLDKAKRLKDSSNILYACLEARNLLELISTTKLLCAVPEGERNRLVQLMKPQHGISAADKELKALGLKTQEFMNVISAQENMIVPVFQFAACKKLQDRLSQYVHNYTVSVANMNYGSSYLNDGLKVIKEAVDFAKANLAYDSDRNVLYISNMDMTNMPEWGNSLLMDWKEGRIKDKDALEVAIAEGVRQYIESQKRTE
jgi:hypothetical protein